MEPVPVEPELLSGSEWFQYHPFMGYWHRSTLPEYRKMEPVNKTTQIVGQPSNGPNGATSATSANSFEGSQELTVKKSGAVPFNWNRSRYGTAQEPVVQLSLAFIHTEYGSRLSADIISWGLDIHLHTFTPAPADMGEILDGLKRYGGAPGGGKSRFNEMWRSLRTPPQTDDDGPAENAADDFS